MIKKGIQSAADFEASMSAVNEAMEAMTEQQEPRTEAGRSLLGGKSDELWLSLNRRTMCDYIVAIEREAVRVRCVCGREVLAENAANHLLRRSNGPHRIVSAALDIERLGAAMHKAFMDQGWTLQVSQGTSYEFVGAVIAAEYARLSSTEEPG